MCIGRNAFLLVAWLLAAAAGGCTYTVTPTGRMPLEPAAPAVVPLVEHAVGDFTFAFGSGDPRTSTLDGRLLSGEIMAAWKARGYVRDERFVDERAFSGTADYNLTLSGNQRNEASFLRELANALTLMLLPYTVTHHYDLQYVVDDVKRGKQYSASVQETDFTDVGLLVIFGFPFAQRGHDATVQRVAAQLYEDLHRQGAFELVAVVPAESK